LIEQVRAAIRKPARVVMFDFDGTVGMVRAGWMPLMLDMMMETLGPLGGNREEAEEYIAKLTGKDTLHQMQAFADHVAALGGAALSAEEYKALFMERLERLRSARLSAVESGAMPADALLIPGCRPFLGALQAEGIRLFLASGSAHHEILRESNLLRIEDFFEGIYGSAPESLTKRELLAHLIASGVDPNEILTFGDGRVEIEETKLIGGTAVGTATDEPECLRVDEKKRRWLIEAGADYIIPNYLEPALLALVLDRQ